MATVGVDAADFGFVLDVGAFERGDRPVVGGLRRVDPGQPLLDIIRANCLFLGQLVEHLLLILRVSEFDFGSSGVLRRHVDIQLLAP